MMPRRIPIRRSLHRENLIAGCERELILFSGILSFALVVIGQSVSTAIVGAGIWILSIAIFRRMARKDPLLSRVYLRHIRYKSFYSAKSRSARVS